VSSLEDQIATKSQQPRSLLAQALLSSSYPPKYSLMCAGERHKLGHVFQKSGELILAVPRRKMLASFLYSDADPASKDHVVLVPWTYWLTGEQQAPNTGIFLRCRCGTFYTEPAKIRQQIATQPKGDRWLIVGRAISARHNPNT